MGVIRMRMTGLGGLLRKGMPLGLVASFGCNSYECNNNRDNSNDTGRDSSYPDDSGDNSDTGGGIDTHDIHETGKQNSAPIITTNSLPNAMTQTAYSAQITAIDTDGDALSYSLITTPPWLGLDSFGVLSGIPTTRGTELVEVLISDGLFDVVQQYNLVVDPIATAEMNVIDGDNGSAVDNSCNIDVILTNSSLGYNETVTAVDGIAAFSLDEIGTYNISVPSTNTGSTCYSGFSQSEWVDVVVGVNSSWVTLIPEWYQDEVRDVVGGQLDMGDIYSCGLSGDVDSVTELVQYMSGRHCYNSTTQQMIGWEEGIRDGSSALEVDTIDWEYNGIQYNDGLELAISHWNGSFAPNIEQVSSGGEIWFTRSSNWDGDNREYDISATGVYTISSCEVEYTNLGGSGTIDDVATLFTHEIGHCFSLRHTNISSFIMDQSPTVNEPHELELLTTRIINNIGNENPRSYPINLFGY